MNRTYTVFQRMFHNKEGAFIFSKMKQFKVHKSVLLSMYNGVELSVLLFL